MIWLTDEKALHEMDLDELLKKKKVIKEEWIIDYKEGDEFLGLITFKRDYYAIIKYPKFAVLFNFLLFFGTIGAIIYMTFWDAWGTTFSVGRIDWHLRTMVLYVSVYTIVQLKTSRFFGSFKAQFLAGFCVLGGFATFEMFHLIFDYSILHSVLFSELWFNNAIQIGTFFIPLYFYVDSVRKFYFVNYKVIVLVLLVYISIWLMRFNGMVFDEFDMSYWLKVIGIMVWEIFPFFKERF